MRNIEILKQRNLLGLVNKLVKNLENYGTFYIFGSALQNLNKAKDLDLIFVPRADVQVPTFNDSCVYIQYSLYRKKQDKPIKDYIDLVIDETGVFHKKILNKIPFKEWLSK